MAQYQAFSQSVKVGGVTVLSVVNALSFGQDTRREILEKHGISNPTPGEFYDLQNYLDAFREIGEDLGPKTLFTIGKAIPENAEFPPAIDSLEKALSAIDVAYHMNHTEGEIGYYKLLSFDAKARKAVMECRNPYPSEFDRGIIMTMLRRFKPADSRNYEVELDSSKETRQNGGELCTYQVSW